MASCLATPLCVCACTSWYKLLVFRLGYISYILYSVPYSIVLCIHPYLSTLMHYCMMPWPLHCKSQQSFSHRLHTALHGQCTTVPCTLHSMGSVPPYHILSYLVYIPIWAHSCSIAWCHDHYIASPSNRSVTDCTLHSMGSLPSRFGAWNSGKWDSYVVGLVINIATSSLTCTPIRTSRIPLYHIHRIFTDVTLLVYRVSLNLVYWGKILYNDACHCQQIPT